MKKTHACTPPALSESQLRLFDEAAQRCRHIATLAGLLESCDKVAGAQPMERGLAAGAGALLAEEAGRLLALLNRSQSQR